MALPTFLQSFLFEQPSSSIFITSLPALTLVMLIYLDASETMGNHLQYSKFWNVKPSFKKQVKVSSRTGMLLLYTPAFMAGFASFFLFPGGGFRFMLLKSAVTLHFLKRDFEVLFVHKYSGGMTLDSTALISVSYFFVAADMIFIQYLTLGLPEPSIDLKYPGLALVLVGLIGNFYHHVLLSKLRTKNDQGYKIPRGGLFDLVICPHYLFEIIGFLGFAFVGQTLLSLVTAIGVAMYLATRSYATRKWKKVNISSRTGMLILYTPAFLAGVASFFLFPGGGFRFLLLKSGVTLHFFKRDFEVLFVHKYSGAMILDSTAIISVLYFFGAASMTFIQYLTLGMPEPLIDLKYPGVLLALVGLFGNFYHHILLSKLRGKNEDQGYKIPKGGLFDLVVCPHYLFEILVFLGFAFIGQTFLSLSIAIGVAMYLAARSYATRKWYLTKFENFPKNVKALIPYIY